MFDNIEKNQFYENKTLYYPQVLLKKCKKHWKNID